MADPDYSVDSEYETQDNDVEEAANIGSNLIEESSSESEDDPPVLRQPGWNDPQGNHCHFGMKYLETGGIRPEFAASLVDLSPFDFYSVFIDQAIIELMVAQTNLYATQVLTSGEDVSKGSRLHQWTPTSNSEMRKFLGLIGYMGLVRMSTLCHYWSRKRLYCSPVSDVMSRNRFELLLHLWHFTDNELCPPGDRTFKIHPFIEKIVNKYQEVFTPSSTFCVDESLVPFRGRLIFKQYIPLKTHKY